MGFAPPPPPPSPPPAAPPPPSPPPPPPPPPPSPPPPPPPPLPSPPKFPPFPPPSPRPSPPPPRPPPPPPPPPTVEKRVYFVVSTHEWRHREWTSPLVRRPHAVLVIHRETCSKTTPVLTRTVIRWGFRGSPLASEWLLPVYKRVDNRRGPLSNLCILHWALAFVRCFKRVGT
jgi:hypothetical protein